MENFKRYLFVFLIIAIAMCSTFALSANASANVQDGMTDDIVENIETSVATEELQPLMARGCNSVPGSAYSMYTHIVNGGDTSIYTYHEYANTSAPRLPRSTTYVTYYMAGLARLVIGADGSAYYTSNHYKSWIRMY